MRHGSSGLHSLLRGYFHQDWDLEYATEEDVITGYTDEATPASLQRLTEEVDALLAEDGSEDALAAWFRKTWVAYHPPGGGWTYRGFLEHVRARTAEELERR